MIASFFHTFLYVPIYNLLVFLVGIIPGGDIGLAVVAATLIVKLVLMPLSLSAVRTQRRMKSIEKELKELREKHKKDKEAQAREMLALYRAHGIRPFSSMLGILIQLPIVLALYFVFSRQAILNIDPSLLYGFVDVPAQVAPLFLNLFTVTGNSLPLALLAAVAQLAHARLSISVPEKSTDTTPSIGKDFGRAMAIQARFVLPLVVGGIAYFTSGAVALYFITSSIVGLLQEGIVRATKD